MATVFEVLARDHEEVKRLLAELELGSARASGADSDQLAGRRRLAERLVSLETRHEAAEEAYLWPAVRERLADGDELAGQALAQERQGTELIRRLAVLAPESNEFENVLTEFISTGRTHLAFEEAVVWPGLRAALSTGEAEALGREIQDFSPA